MKLLGYKIHASLTLLHVAKLLPEGFVPNHTPPVFYESTSGPTSLPAPDIVRPFKFLQFDGCKMISYGVWTTRMVEHLLTYSSISFPLLGTGCRCLLLI